MKKIVYLLMLVALAALAAGCGGDDSSSDDDSASDDVATQTDSAADDASGDATPLEINVKAGEFKFEEEDVQVATAGTYEISSTNPDAVGHNIHVSGNGVDEAGELVEDGGVSTVTVELESGKTYEFWCDPHKDGGMVGKITVA